MATDALGLYPDSTLKRALNDALAFSVARAH
jgi:hypothetical protein